MSALSRSTRSLVLFVTLGICFLAVAPTSYACSPAPPDPWFTERMTTVSSQLPPGVDVRVIQLTRYGRTRDYIEITNRSATSLYVVGRPWSRHTASDPIAVTLPAGVTPTHRIVGQQATTWQPIFDTPQSQARMGWTQETDERKDAVLLEIHHDTLQSNQADIVDLASRNRTGDNRPANVPLPEPQMIEAPLVYGTQLLSVPITVSYTLNPTYNPHSVARSLAACQASTVPIILVVSVVAGMLAGCAALGWLSYRQR